MDLYSYDHKLSELGEHDFNDMLEDQDVFSTRNVITESYGVDEDWLDSLFEDPVLNDRMISEAIESPQIKSEHSYSLSKNGQRSDSPDSLTDAPKAETEMETDLILTQTMNPNTNMIQQVKEEPQEQPETTTQTFIATTASSVTNSQQSLIKQPTIILATQQNLQNSLVKQESLVLPNVNVKLEPASPVSSHGDQSLYDCMEMPPTPPSSTNSDSEGGQSPQRSAPSSPVRPMQSLRHASSLRALSSQPLFTSPIPTSGVLVLSEEEKRTLISEGYPIPSKLPLTKQEEKNLKKIRRKIKNKISAQESRRKKKEYLETLEKRVEAFSSENSDLRKKVDSLENNNRSLLSQLHKLQALVGKATTTSQTGTCLMVLVLCFAVFVGCWSPINFANVGYGSAMQSPLPMTQAGISGIPMGPEVKDAVVETYTTPKMRSRVLLSTEEEAELEHYGPHAPFSYKTIFSGIFPSVMNVDSSEGKSAVMQPPMPEAEVTSPVVEKETTHSAQISANVVSVDARTTQNATA